MTSKFNGQYNYEVRSELDKDHYTITVLANDITIAHASDGLQFRAMLQAFKQVTERLGYVDQELLQHHILQTLPSTGGK